MSKLGNYMEREGRWATGDQRRNHALAGRQQPVETEELGSMPITRRVDEPSPDWHAEPISQVLRRERPSRNSPQEAEIRPSIAIVPKGSREVQDLGEVGWEAYGWKPPQNLRSQRTRGAGVATFAGKLIALERNRMRRGTPANLLAPLRRKKFNLRG